MDDNHGANARLAISLVTAARHLSNASRVSSGHFGVLRSQIAAAIGSPAGTVGWFSLLMNGGISMPAVLGVGGDPFDVRGYEMARRGGWTVFHGG
jgi:hypothetical protein